MATQHPLPKLEEGRFYIPPMRTEGGYLILRSARIELENGKLVQRDVQEERVSLQDLLKNVTIDGGTF